MGRKRTLNYRDFRGDFDESDERRKKEDEEGGDDDEEEDEDDDEEGDDEEGGDEEEAAAGGGGDEDEAASDDEDGEAPPKKKKKKVKEKVEKPKRVKKPRASKIVRMRVVWGVFNNSNQRVASFDYAKREEADADAKKRAEDKKQTFFVQPVKEPIEEKKEEK